LADDDLSTGRFGSSRPFSLGVEEELFLVDPLTGEQVNSSGAVLEALGPTSGTVERELHACQVELITEVCASAGEAVAALSDLRRDVLATGAGLLGAGTHPSAAEGAAEITDKARYERIRDQLGDAVATPVGGLHVHVGMADPDAAIRAFNGLRDHLPLLVALAANSPFRHGRDTGLASARELTLRSWPRSGAPRAMRDYDDFVQTTRRLVRAADVPDYTWLWWKLRPHPRLGTVEVRALDAQADPRATAAIVALTHAAAPRPELAPELFDEGVFRAARFGVRARLPDADGELRPVAQLLAAARRRAADHAVDLGCEAELGLLDELMAAGGEAGRQRSARAIAGMGGLLRDTVARTAGGEGVAAAVVGG
jgi:glutamate---cysteine ligase / carboxylate-amine ligase